MQNEIPRPEHPRPQFERKTWRNLNGEWTFTFDFGKSGRERELNQSLGFDRKILVPFCPESTLSGVGHTDFIEMMWYQRTLDIPAEWAGQKILLNFGAVDFECEAYIDGESVGAHRGGTSSFAFDITRFVNSGSSHNLVLYVRDETRSRLQPGGKQSHKFNSHGCSYTRTTGIWQTVWLEAVNPLGLESVRILPDLDNSSFAFIPVFHTVEQGLKWRITVKDGEKIVAQTESNAVNGIPVSVTLEQPKVWSPEDAFLYDITFEVIEDGQIVDTVRSYAGLRKIHVEGNQVFLNNAPLYQRLVLDQGFYPDGIWTAPSDDALKNDIVLSMKAGFNGARLHQKVFEERFHYWADKLGYLTWAESSSWGIDLNNEEAQRNFLNEWREIMQRDWNHPSIITWTPLNETVLGWPTDHEKPETYRPHHYRLHVDTYDLTRTLDSTRPINETSGYVHVKTDLYTIHEYEQDPAKLKELLAPDPEKGVYIRFPEVEVPYAGQPYLVDEFGGIKWIPIEEQVYAENSWGYGDAPKTLDELYERLQGQVDAILSLPHICGYCYTQLTDVEQEQNGVYNYDRSEKFDMGRIAGIFGRDPQ